MQALQPTQDPSWVLTHEGYNVLTENAVESRFALGNGFLGMRASRPVSRGPTWVSWLGYIRWASWPRCYVAGLFDRPNTVPPVPALVPVADWSRVRLVLDDNPQLLLDGEFLASVRQLDLRRGMLLSDLSYRAHAGITISGGELRLVSLADRAVALQLLRFSLDRDGIDVTLEANFAMAGMGMEPLQLDRDVCAWRTEGSGKAVAMAGSVTLRADGRPLVPERSFSLRWIWRWRSVAGQVLELDRLVTVARSDRLADDPAPVAADALARSRALGWRGVLAAHETAWQQRWDASDVIIEGDDEVQEAVRFAVYHLTSAANPEDERVSVGARGLTGDAYFGHVFWDTEIYLLPFYVGGLAGGGARAAHVSLSHSARRARQGRRDGLQRRALRLGIGRHRRGDHARARGGSRRRDDRHPDRQDGASHQRRYRLCGVAVLACDGRRRVLHRCRRGDPAGDRSFLGVARRAGGGWQAAYPPRDRA